MKTKIKNLKIAIISLSILSSLFISVPTSIALSVGVGPSYIEILHASKGKEYERMILVSNAGKNDVNFSLIAVGDIKNWTSFYRYDNATTPIHNVTVKRNGSEKIIVKFDIPDNVANDNYTGTIYVEPLSPETSNQSGHTSVALRLPVNVLIEVIGTQYLAGVVKSITTRDIEVNQPLVIRILFENTGDVFAKPMIQVGIKKDKIFIENFTYSSDRIEVGLEKYIYATWSNTSRIPGEYIANVTVLLDGKILAEKNLSFKILPRGTLTRRGELINLSYSGEPTKGNIIKILAEFKNTGEVETNAKLIGEVYRDGKLVETIESDEILVLKGETVQFTTYLKINDMGKYMLKSYILYETNKTAVKTVSFEVGAPLGNIVTIGILSAGAVVVVAVGAISFFKKRKNKIDEE